MKFAHFVTLILLLISLSSVHADSAPKREFRGTWIQTIYQAQYAGMSQKQMKQYFCELLDGLQYAGINAIIFQMRPSADAFYNSQIEPWSKWFTGKQGNAPAQEWDPADFLIKECHKRNMEFHAWLNPYRVATNSKEKLAPNHIFHQHPEWFVEYDGKLFFDPGYPQTRKYVREVIKDIVTRYDVDAIHFDDYFYPYPAKGQSFSDDNSFLTYHKKMNFKSNQREDWRRQNINILIKSIREDIIQIKPWVRFGISPFGIYRNHHNDPDGSLTNGLQNFDDLYADILFWSNQGWIDYVIPQLYWEIGHKQADYKTLVKWWNDHANNSHMYIGQSISRSLDQNQALSVSDHHFSQKMDLARRLTAISGNCFWYGYQINENEKQIATVLHQKYHAHPALIPAYTSIDDKAPKEVKKLRTRWTANGYELQWRRRDTDDEFQKQIYFAIYRFKKGEKKDLSKSVNLIGTTRNTYYLLPFDDGETKYEYVVTALDRMHNESTKGKSKKVKL
ncbi:MAG: glycoside hydrolase family 10 protein [Bacteroidales bacterium]